MYIILLKISDDDSVDTEKNTKFYGRYNAFGLILKKCIHPF